MIHFLLIIFRYIFFFCLEAKKNLTLKKQKHRNEKEKVSSSVAAGRELGQTFFIHSVVAVLSLFVFIVKGTFKLF